VAFLAVAGCGQSTGKVSGKVSYKGAILKGGTVSFFAADKRNATTTIKEDGTYTVENVPVGPVKITVDTDALKPKAGVGGPSYKPPPGMTPPGGYAPPDPAEMAKRYVQIPPQYADQDKTTLTYTVKSGSQEHEIKLD